MRKLQWSYVNVDSCDVLTTLKNALCQLEGSIDGIALGKSAGDILNKDPASISWPIDALLAGPPCPPRAGQGRRI